MLILFVNLLRQNYRYGRMCSTSECCCCVPERPRVRAQPGEPLEGRRGRQQPALLQGSPLDGWPMMGQGLRALLRMTGDAGGVIERLD